MTELKTLAPTEPHVGPTEHANAGQQPARLQEDKAQNEDTQTPSRVGRIIGLVILGYGGAGLVTLIILILSLKYSHLMSNEKFFVELVQKTPPETLSSGEALFFKFVFEVPGLIFGALFGAFGALLSYLRAARVVKEKLSSKNDAFLELSIGSLMGIAAYLVVQSRSLPKVLHPSINVENIPDTNVFIAALVCFVAGLFSGDLIETAEKRFRQLSGAPRRQKK